MIERGVDSLQKHGKLFLKDDKGNQLRLCLKKKDTEKGSVFLIQSPNSLRGTEVSVKEPVFQKNTHFTIHEKDPDDGIFLKFGPIQEVSVRD